MTAKPGRGGSAHGAPLNSTCTHACSRLIVVFRCAACRGGSARGPCNLHFGDAVYSFRVPPPCIRVLCRVLPQLPSARFIPGCTAGYSPGSRTRANRCVGPIHPSAHSNAAQWSMTHGRALHSELDRLQGPRDGYKDQGMGLLKALCGLLGGITESHPSRYTPSVTKPSTPFPSLQNVVPAQPLQNRPPPKRW